MSETKLIKLSLVRIDGQTQYRDLVDQNTVKEYADCMRDEAEFPPVRCTFDGTHYWLWDGFHRYLASEAAGFRDIRVEFTRGSKEDAQDLALGANGRHGLPRNSATKRKQVEAALSMERHAHKSDRDIAKLCDVSHTFVAVVRNPETKKQRDNNRESSFLRRAVEPGSTNSSKTTSAGVIGLHPDTDPIPRLTEYYGPDENELRASELAQQANLERFQKMLDENPALAEAYEECRRLNLIQARLEVRIAALMTEKNEAVKQAKRVQTQIDRQRKLNKLAGATPASFV
jgi:hypothetical protein